MVEDIGRLLRSELLIAEPAVPSNEIYWNCTTEIDQGGVYDRNFSNSLGWSYYSAGVEFQACMCLWQE